MANRAPTLALTFGCAYLLLYNAPAWLGVVPPIDAAWQAARYAAVPWVGEHVLRLDAPITTFPNGSGDTTYNWVEVGCYAAIAALVAPLWTWLDARRPHLAAAPDLVRTLARYTVGAAMVGYGLAKFPPGGQFPALSEHVLGTAVGDLTPMALLWTFMGFSPAYAAFAGVAEVVGGLLLFFRRTSTLGALIVAAVMTNVLALNLCYDVPVKLYAAHLLAMTLIVLAPAARRLAAAVLEPGPAFAAAGRPARAARAVAKAGFLGLMAWTIAVQAGATWTGAPARLEVPRATYAVVAWEEGPDRRPPRWHRLDTREPGRASILREGGPAERLDVLLDPGARLITLAAGGRERWTLSVDGPAEAPLVLRSRGAGVPVTVRLREDPPRYPLLSRGFHWINERPHGGVGR